MSATRRARLLLLTVAGLAAALALGACGSDDDGGGDSGGSATIGFLLPESQTARYESQDKPLFEGKVEELCPDCTIFYQNADQDPAKQQQQVEAAVTEGVDVLVLDPVDSTASGGLASRAKQAGIPVISYDRLILDTDLDYYVSFDSVEVGKQQGDALAQKLADDGSPNGPIVQINGSPTDNNASQFEAGAVRQFEAASIEVAKKYDTPDWSPDEAQREMEQAITALGQDGFKGVYAMNDGTAGGAIAAMKGAGLDPKTIPTTGQDAELEAIQRILVGEQFMTVYKATLKETDAAAQIAVALAQGEAVPEGLVNGETDNGVEAVPSVLLEPVEVTVDNIQDTVVADGFLTPDEICVGQYAQACEQAGVQ